MVSMSCANLKGIIALKTRYNAFLKILLDKIEKLKHNALRFTILQSYRYLIKRLDKIERVFPSPQGAGRQCRCGGKNRKDAKILVREQYQISTIFFAHNIE